MDDKKLSRAEYLQLAKRQHKPIRNFLKTPKLHALIADELGPSSELVLFKAMCNSAAPVNSSRFEEQIGVVSAVSEAAKRLGVFLEKFSQRFPIMLDEGVVITIPRKRGRIQVGYFFACFSRQSRRFLTPDETDGLLEKAWEQYRSSPGKAGIGSFKEYLCDSREFIADKTKDFVGRAFVFEAIEAFIQKHKSGYFFVKGDPGIGKSSVASWLVKKNGYIHHFNRLARKTGNAEKFLRNVCAQLILEYGLDYSSLPADMASDDRFFLQLLREVSERLGASNQAIIVVDALDEVDNIDTCRSNLLNLPPNLPEGIFIIATVRRGVELPLRIECDQDDKTIVHNKAENLRDIDKFLNNKVSQPKIAAYIKNQGLDDVAFVKLMSEKSDGNFMYLRHVLPEIEEGPYKNLALKELPKGLQNYYEDHWRRMKMMASPPPELKLKIIYIFCEAVEPVARELVADIGSEGEVEVQKVLTEWDQFLHSYHIDDERRFGIYHESFRDFLHRKDIVQAAGINLPDINKMIADYFFDALYGNA